MTQNKVFKTERLYILAAKGLVSSLSTLDDDNSLIEGISPLLPYSGKLEAIQGKTPDECFRIRCHSTLHNVSFTVALTPSFIFGFQVEVIPVLGHEFDSIHTISVIINNVKDILWNRVDCAVGGSYSFSPDARIIPTP